MQYIYVYIYIYVMYVFLMNISLDIVQNLRDVFTKRFGNFFCRAVALGETWVVNPR